MQTKKRILSLSIIVLLIVIIMSIIYLKNNSYNKFILEPTMPAVEENINTESKINYEEIVNNVKEEYKNDDIVGILEINNTDYIVPLLQGPDNDYYLNHTPNGKRHYMGSIYLDYRVNIDNSKKLLIYGHNSSNVDMPFKILEEYYDQNYYNEHKYIEITTTKTKKKYEIFSVHVETSDFSYMNINFDNNEEYYQHIKTLKSRSMYDTEVELSENDEILILQTCSEHKDYRKYPKKYLLIVLKRIK